MKKRSKISKKSLFLYSSIPYVLSKLYFYSHFFTRDEYEIYVHATHRYFEHVYSTPFSSITLQAFHDLYCLANSFKSFFAGDEYTALNSILNTYFAKYGR